MADFVDQASEKMHRMHHYSMPDCHLGVIIAQKNQIGFVYKISIA